MTSSKNTKRALLASALSVLLCAAMLIGTTFAWFTDTVTSGNNKIVAGDLDIELYQRGADGSYTPVTEETKLFDDSVLWEPGYAEVVYLKIANLGSLAAKYKIAINVANEVAGESVLEGGPEILLSDFLKFGVISGDTETVFDDRADAIGAVKETAGNLAAYSKEGKLAPAGKEETFPDETAATNDSDFVTIVVYMPTDVGNEANHITGGTQPSIEMGVQLLAAQASFESDSFGDDYDEGAEYPWDGVTMTEVVPDAEGNYNVSSAAQLAWMAHEINEQNINGITIVLRNDIDLNGKAWTPIRGDDSFSGTFDGNGHTIKNLTASKNAASSDPTRGVALFGYVEDAVIKNVKFENVQTQGRYSVAAVVGDGAGDLTFENIEILSGSIQSNQNVPGKTAQVAGGILGQAWGNSSSETKITFRNCVNRADVTVNKQHAGGLWGSITTADRADVTVESCRNYGNITSLSQDAGGYAGGFGGYFAAKSLTVTDSANNGAITADKFLGNFVGYSTLADGPVNE